MKRIFNFTCGETKDILTTVPDDLTVALNNT